MTSTQYIDHLHQLLNRYFDLEELRTLCFVLSIDYDSLKGEGKTARTRELILHLSRTNRLPDLLTYTRRERPHVQWPDPPADLQLPEAVESGSSPSTVYHINTSGGDFIGRDRTTHGDEIRGSKYEMSGDFRGAVLNIQSRLNNVTQSIAALPHGSPSDRTTLTLLLDDLKAELATLPPESAADVETITRRLESLTQELQSPNPDPELITIISESLNRTATRLAPLNPTIPTLTTRLLSQTHSLTN